VTSLRCDFAMTFKLHCQSTVRIMIDLRTDSKSFATIGLASERPGSTKRPDAPHAPGQVGRSALDGHGSARRLINGDHQGEFLFENGLRSLAALGRLKRGPVAQGWYSETARAAWPGGMCTAESNGCLDQALKNVPRQVEFVRQSDQGLRDGTARPRGPPGPAECAQQRVMAASTRL
jgi:hypothetical protein